MRESMPLLLTESLDAAQRELTHQHIERCELCSEEWTNYRDTWRIMGDLPELAVPAHVKARFLATAGIAEETPKVVQFRRRFQPRWLAEAAAAVIVAGGAYYAGHQRQPVALQPTPAIVQSVMPYSIAESRVIPAKSISPTIEGRPDIQNFSFVDANTNDEEIGVSFDITSHVTVTGKPTDKSMVRLLRYVLENEDRMTPSRSRAIDWVRAMYSRPGNADPEIAEALANVLRSDPNPAVRIKAVEALANLARSGATLDASMLDTLREKASQKDENPYVRVKAAETLSNIRP